MRVTYHYPKWTGMQPVSEEHGGDLRAIEGTNAELTVRMDRPLRNGQLTLDDGKQITDSIFLRGISVTYKAINNRWLLYGDGRQWYTAISTKKKLSWKRGGSK